VGTYFQDGPGHLFDVHPPLEIPEHEDFTERVRLGTQLFAARLEEIIRRAPQQWHVIVPNWPSDGEHW
jgi:KDO2-lipid IV(A) lauroyltransferase